MAHGKPIKEKFDEVVEGDPSELDRRMVGLVGEWEQHCNPETVSIVFEDVEKLWKELITAAKLDIWDTMTRGQSGLTFIEEIIESSGSKLEAPLRGSAM